MTRFTSNARSSLPALVAISLYACSLQNFEYLQEGEAGAAADAGKGGKGGTAGANGTGATSGTGGGANGGNAGSFNTSGGTAGEEAGQGGQAASTAGASAEGGAPAGGTSAGTTSAGGAPSAGQAGEGGAPMGTGGDVIDSGGRGGEPSSEGGAGGQPPLVGNLLANPGFEARLTGWSVDPSVAATNRYVYTQPPNPANDTSLSLAVWHQTSAYEFTIYQTVSGLEPGTYTFKGEFSTDSIQEAYLFARCGEEGEEVELTQPVPLQGYEWFPVVMQSFTVTADRCEVGLYVRGIADVDWLNADNWSFEKDS